MRKSVQHLALTALLLTGCATHPPVVAVKAEPSHYAWWLRTTFHPRGKTLRGIPVGSINSLWCRINELEPGIFPSVKESLANNWDPSSERAIYSTPGFSVDGQPSLLLLAVYTECSGDTGTALVLLNGDGQHPRRVISAESISSPASWATIELVSNTVVRVWWCFECDSMTDLGWDPISRRFSPLPSPDEQEL